IIWIGVFQYCFIRILFTVVSVVTEELGRYCEASLSPAFAHVWVTAFEALSVTIAMFCLIQFYLQLRYDLAEHKPFLKVLCIKLVIFFSFWQTIIISLLSSGKGPLQPSAKISYQDIKVGIPAVMLCIEMAIFAVMHLFAFPWKEYVIDKHSPANPLAMSGAGYSGASPRYQGGFLGIKAMADAFNPWDIIKASARGFRWLFVGYRKREADPSYQNGTGRGAAAQQAKLDGLAPGYPPGHTSGGNGAGAPVLWAGGVGLGQRSTDEGDRAGLLRHSANMGGGRGANVSPYRTETGEEDVSGDEARMGQYHAPPRTGPPGYESKGQDYGPPGRPTMRDTEFGDEDTGYHPGVGPAQGAAGSRGSVHPAYRAEGGAAVPAPSWDPWAGAQRSDQESLRAPTYRTQDPHG
ncbi:hypothetical protein LTR33_013473, partial [Friedmanniomyces endolithicus]